MNLAVGEPQYVISAKELFWGGTLVAITMSMHGLGILTILRVSEHLNH